MLYSIYLKVELFQFHIPVDVKICDLVAGIKCRYINFYACGRIWYRGTEI